MKDLRVASVCMRSKSRQVARNLDRMEELVSEAADQGAEILCFPELSVTGYTLNDPRSIYGKETLDEVMDRLEEMAKKAGVVVLAGLVEVRRGAGLFITQALFGPHGPVGLYRKTHLSPPERKTYDPGSRIQVFRCGDVTLGVQLCYEAHFPEISTTMALMGAEILFFPHASPRGNAEEKLSSWLRHLPGRAFDNGVYVVACNQVGCNGEGLHFPGVALALDPKGRTLATYTGQDEKILMVELEAESLRRVREHRMSYFIPHRRPDLYRKLVEE